jgi:ABC-type multidrug transport system ATPase subunit
VTLERQCAHCGAQIGPRDRVCFSCHRPADVPGSATRKAVPTSGRGIDAVPAPDLVPGLAPDLAGQERGNTRAPVQIPAGVPQQGTQADRQAMRSQDPPEPIQVELIWGSNRRLTRVPLAGLTIGSTSQSGLVVPVGFLAPVHARIVSRDSHWVVERVDPSAQVIVRGSAVASAPISPGDMFRLADRVGNFVTVKVPAGGGRPGVANGLRAVLPGIDESYLIGSATRCQVRLDHPLIQPRHVAVRRDSAGVLWLEDRGTAAGTYLNGHRLRGSERAAVGDVLQVGPYSARIGTSALEPLEQVAGVDVRVHDARVDAPGPSARGTRTLLNHVSLRLAPASMTAVAGPSGAGKTTLMRLLSGQLPAADGSVSYNGTDLARCREAYASLMGYVPQEDIVHADLTVGEALGYQAKLRLGLGTPAEVRAARIDHVLALIGLLDQRDQLVKTLSGGQRKRVSIACELLSEPQILFLDEPTSGLDPGLDKRMMLLLRLLADQGRTVVLTTHAIAHVDVCDTLVLVGPGGHVIYSGAPDAALDWFGVRALGDVFSLVETPAAAGRAADRVLAAQGADGSGPGVPVDAPPPAGLSGDAPGGVGGARPPLWSPAWRRAVASQTRIFAGRYVRLIGRDRTALAFSLLQGVAVALLTALAVPKPFSWTTSGNAPMFVFGCAAVWFGMIGAVRELVKEKAIWRREFLAGGDLPAYLASKVTVLGALAAFQALTLTLAASLALGLPSGGPLGHPFLTVFITAWLAIISGMALGLLVSAASTSADRAMSLVPYLLITQLVLCGVLFRLGAMTFLSWIMPARWSVSGLGGIAGLSANLLHQTAGLYPHSGSGLVGNWLMLLVLTACGLAVTIWLLYREGQSWSVGSDRAGRLRLGRTRLAAPGPGGNGG